MWDECIYGVIGGHTLCTFPRRRLRAGILLYCLKGPPFGTQHRFPGMLNITTSSQMHQVSFRNAWSFQPILWTWIFILSSTLSFTLVLPPPPPSLISVPTNAPWVLVNLCLLSRFHIPDTSSGDRGIIFGILHIKAKLLIPSGRPPFPPSGPLLQSPIPLGVVTKVSAINNLPKARNTRLPGKWPPSFRALTPVVSPRTSISSSVPSMKVRAFPSRSSRLSHFLSSQLRYTGQPNISAHSR